tara:strand:- start:95 stop:364 length:270 start_codon:yes stop_codon:yes gene_type:complete
MREEKKYPFIMMEIWTDQDKRSETYREKYITVSCVPFKDGRADSDNIMTVKSDRFTIEHHSLNDKDQIKLSKGNLQVFQSQDFEGLGEE